MPKILSWTSLLKLNFGSFAHRSLSGLSLFFRIKKKYIQCQDRTINAQIYVKDTCTKIDVFCDPLPLFVFSNSTSLFIFYSVSKKYNVNNK